MYTEYKSPQKYIIKKPNLKCMVLWRHVHFEVDSTFASDIDCKVFRGPAQLHSPRRFPYFQIHLLLKFILKCIFKKTYSETLDMNNKNK